MLRGRHRVPRHAGGLRRGRERHLPQADGRTATCRAEFVDAVRHIDYSQRELQDQHRPRASCPTSRRCPGTAAGPAAPRHHPHLARPWSTSSGPTTTRSTAGPSQAPDHRGDDPLGARRHAGAPGQARDVDVHPVLPLQAGARALAGRGEGEVRRPLLRPDERVRAQLQALGDRTGRCSRRWTWSSGSGSPAGTSCRA